ncbi:hypothetical protein SARC_07421 [Sphaeroforma arctica JP610]|uniref:Dynamin N-terminal domain-containing protein n=1 Tax=Sphaeroforma arctica JP610 TaxID=667725 RepID=A0A0L0FUI5_9EUKA|nr:hypothetical protein SARC_07421 [Sphaeroforma arctica JP610]KNC80211.1 hypothetical protein SARC_07421 [Sphaeroforma arctica JP610]|eukprot:XP_014154113.1 hypothetical protein SARC_07421 [Sphaeroforma arctica JP610]
MCIAPSTTDDGLTAVLSNGVYGEILRAFDQLKLKDSTLHVPKFVVVGDENVGKSSTLERIAEYKIFPTGVGFTTRMITKLMLRHTDKDDQVTIRVVNRNSGNIARDNLDKLYELNIPVGNDYRNGETDIREHVLEIINKFTIQTGDNLTKQDVEMDHEFQVEVQSSRVTTLDLYDMPGIVSDPPNVAKNTRRLTMGQLTDPNVIAICVLSAQTNLRNFNILNQIREANERRAGETLRAIGVLTHVDKSTPERVRKMIGDFLPRSPLQSLIPLINEDTNPIDDRSNGYTENDFQDAGSAALVQHLDSELRTYMRDFWLGEQKQKLQRCREDVNNKISALGAVADTDMYKNLIAATVHTVIKQHFRTILENLQIDSQMFATALSGPNAFGSTDITFSCVPTDRLNKIRFCCFWKSRISDKMSSLISLMMDKVKLRLSSTSLKAVLISGISQQYVVSRFSAIPGFVESLFEEQLNMERSSISSIMNDIAPIFKAPNNISGIRNELTDVLVEHIFAPVLLWFENPAFVRTLMGHSDCWADDNDSKRLELQAKLVHIEEAEQVIESLNDS